MSHLTERAAAGLTPSRVDWKTRTMVRLGAWLIRLLGLTWRVRVLNDGGWRALRAARKPLIFSLWHGDMLPLLYQHRGEGVAVLISEHRDGELVARTAHHLGFDTVRGSSSRGASRALIGLSRTLDAGHDIAVTPDGPRGPARRYAPGALIAAQRSAAPIVAIGVAASRAWRLRTWDSFQIPKPFARLTIAYSAPTYVEAEDARAASQESARFEAMMGDVARAAHE